MRTQLVSVFVLALPWLASCNGADVSAGAVVTEREVAALAVPEPSAPASEYSARAVTLRLFGTQGEGRAAFATLADTATWDTNNVRVGETIGRGLKLVSVSESAIELLDTTTATRRTVRSGEDLAVRVIEHEFDRAALESGEHVFHISARSLARVASRYGVGTTCEPVAFADRTPCQVAAVAKHSLADRLGLQAGDLLMTEDGEAVTPHNLSAILRSITESKSQSLQLTVARGGIFLARVYLAE
jgi:hypothetical protein